VNVRAAAPLAKAEWLVLLAAAAGSWDALGVHFATAGSDGSWADSQITNMVKEHNKAVNA
jgi:hypothetical protein